MSQHLPALPPAAECVQRSPHEEGQTQWSAEHPKFHRWPWELGGGPGSQGLGLGSECWGRDPVPAGLSTLKLPRAPSAPPLRPWHLLVSCLLSGVLPHARSMQTSQTGGFPSLSGA